MPIPSTACVVWADFITPSIRHVPYLLPVHGRACVTTLLERLQAYFGDRCDYLLLCAADNAVSDALATEAARVGVRFAGTRAIAIADALDEQWRTAPAWRAVALFPANAVLVNCALTEAVLSRHLAGEVDVTVPGDFPPGVAPAVVISATAIAWTRSVAPRAQSCHALAEALAAAAGQASPDTLPAVDLGIAPGDVASVPADTLPASALVIDEPTRLAAAAALAAHPRAGGWEPLQAFKHALIDIVRRPPAPRAARPRDGGRTVLFSCLRTEFSGGEASLGATITGLHRDAFTPVSVFLFEAMLAEQLRQHDVPVEVAGWDFTPLHPANLQYCAALLDEYRPAVVHIDGHPNPALMITAHAQGIPIVGHLRALVGPTLPPVAHLADRIIAVSDAVARDARRNTIDPRKIVRIYNGADAQQLNVRVHDREAIRRSRQVPADAQVIAFVAAMAPYKRLDLLVDALPAIVREVPTAHVVFVGESFPVYRAYVDALRAKVDACGLAAHVTWWGFEPDIGRIHAIADLLVHANPQEPLARGMVEALACGLPIVGPRDGGSTEAIDDGRNGVLYEPGSVEGLAAAVTRVLADPILRQRMSREALAKAADFSVRRHVNQVQALYRELLRERAAAAVREAAV